MKVSMKNIRLMSCIVLAAVMCSASYGQQPVSVALRIPSQPSDTAIGEWSQTGYQVQMPVEKADVATPTRELPGTYAPEVLRGDSLHFRGSADAGSGGSNEK